MACKNCLSFNRQEREKERLLAIVNRYATSARAVALHLKRFCNRNLPYNEMIADAARKAGEEIDQLNKLLAGARARNGMAYYEGSREFAKYLLDNYATGGVISAADVVDAVADWGRGDG